MPYRRALITVSHLTRVFGSFTAVDDLSFHLEKGEVAGFLGVNGAGKTTAMRMLTGYLPATSGSVSIAGRDVLRQSLEVRRRIGYLAESVPLYREHRVREMLAFQGRLHGMDRSAIRTRVSEVLEQVGLVDRADHLVGTLSKGLRQRVGIAVALLPDPEVLIFDEPTSGLDPLQRIAVRELIADLADRRTVLVSSHILPEIEAVCRRVIILHKGRMAADGTPAELVARLGGGSHVQLDAMVPDPEEAMRLLRSLPGVHEVVDHGRLGIHHRFAIRSDDDLREDVGAIAASRRWALRELSWHRPSLEQIFASIALELAPRPESTTAHPTVAPAAAEVFVSPTITLGRPVTERREKAPGEPRPTRTVYNLNPFEAGPKRDLDRPKAVEEDA